MKQMWKILTDRNCGERHGRENSITESWVLFFEK